jgi:hypothetical protein
MNRFGLALSMGVAMLTAVLPLFGQTKPDFTCASTLAPASSKLATVPYTPRPVPAGQTVESQAQTHRRIAVTVDTFLPPAPSTCQGRKPSR